MLPFKLEQELNELISDRNKLLDAVLEDIKGPLTKENIRTDKQILLDYKLASYPHYEEPISVCIDFCKKMDERNKRYGLDTTTDPYELSRGIANEYNKLIQEKLATLHRRFDDVLRLLESIEPTENKDPKKKIGRPSFEKKYFKEFLNCSEEDLAKVMEVLARNFEKYGSRGIVNVVSTLQEKSYFKAKDRKAIWDALRNEFPGLGIDSGLNKHYTLVDKNGSEIKEIHSQLP